MKHWVSRTVLSMALIAATVTTAVVARGQGDDRSSLTRLRGVVSYGTSDSDLRALTGTIAVEHETLASTAPKSQARLALADSSVISIGDRTRVHLGQLSDASERAGDRATTIVLEKGAVRFDVRHSTGGRSNYRFITPTSQTAIRGTVGYIVHGPDGDQVYCVTCEDGDVSITAANETYTIRTGQTLNISTKGRFVTSAAIVANPSVNNPAIDQFLNGFSPFGRKSEGGVDFTSSGSGS